MTQRIFDDFSGLVLSVPTADSTKKAKNMPMRGKGI
jgi:hypothetical protein